MKNSKGFTIVELLAVIGVFIAIGSFITSIIISTLRGNNKTNAIAAVQSNGTYAMDQMVKLIRNARSLDASVSCGTISSPVSATSFAFNGADGGKTTLQCTKDGSNNPLAIASNSASLIDTNLVTWVTCSFSCGRNTPSDYPVIKISFTLKYKTTNANFVDQTASKSAVPFQTSVTMRNQER